MVCEAIVLLQVLNFGIQKAKIQYKTQFDWKHHYSSLILICQKQFMYIFCFLLLYIIQI